MGLQRRRLSKPKYHSQAAKTASIWGGVAFTLSFILHKGFGPAAIQAKYIRVPAAYRFLLPVLSNQITLELKRVTTAAFFTRADIAAMFLLYTFS